MKIISHSGLNQNRMPKSTAMNEKSRCLGPSLCLRIFFCYNTSATTPHFILHLRAQGGLMLRKITEDNRNDH